MRVLIACEYSGRMRRAFMELGHDVLSCDYLPSEDDSPYHYQGDIRDLLEQRWDLMIAHPPCTYLAVSGLHWNKRGVMVDGRPRAELTEEALDFVRMLMNADIPRIAVENPVSCISTRIRKPDQVIQPWWFGEDASKKTCLWLKNLPKLRETNRLPGDDKTRRANQTPGGAEQARAFARSLEGAEPHLPRDSRRNGRTVGRVGSRRRDAHHKNICQHP